MFSTISLLTTTIASIVFIQTPKEWKDNQLDKVDRSALEQLVSYSPPPIPDNLDWIIPEEQSPVSKDPKWSDLLGKVVIVQSWSSTNTRSRQILGAISKLISRSKAPNDVVLITVHTPEDSNLLNKYQVKNKITKPTVVDSSGKFCNTLGFYKDPTNIVIDKNGTVQHVGLGIKGLDSAVNTLIEKEYDPKIKTKQFIPQETETKRSSVYPEFNNNFGRAKNWQGKEAPTFVVEEWLSDEVEVNNRVRVVEFWATWCPPCVKSIPHINEYAKHFKDQVAFVGVSNEKGTKVRSFMKTTKMEYGVATDTKERMKKAISCSAIPLALIISSDGIVRWQGNPLRMSKEIIQQVVNADSGEIVSTKRGRWKTVKADE